jgi:hypothetical protein
MDAAKMAAVNIKTDLIVDAARITRDVYVRNANKLRTDMRRFDALALNDDFGRIFR